MFQTLGCLEGRPWKAYNTTKYVDPHLSIWHMVQTHAHRQHTFICGYPMDMPSSVRDPATTKAILGANVILNLPPSQAFRLRRHEFALRHQQQLEKKKV
jgi:hypothetical protein